MPGSGGAASIDIAEVLSAIRPALTEAAAAAGAAGAGLKEQKWPQPVCLRACAFQSARRRSRCRPPSCGHPAARTRGRRLGRHDGRIGKVARLKPGKLFLIELVRGASGQLRRLAAMMGGRLPTVGTVLWRHLRRAGLGLRLTRGVWRQSGAARIGTRHAHRVPARRIGWLCPGRR
jgi:hypothetical protein